MASPTPTHQPTTDFLALRQAWVERGRPAALVDLYWVQVLEAEAERTNPNRERTPVTPLVVFG